MTGEAAKTRKVSWLVERNKSNGPLPGAVTSGRDAEPGVDTVQFTAHTSTSSSSVSRLLSLAADWLEIMRQSARPTSADRRRDFRRIDEHALSVSLADQHSFRDLMYALLNSHNLTADVDKARYTLYLYNNIYRVLVYTLTYS